MKRQGSERNVRQKTPDVLRSDRYTLNIINEIGGRSVSGNFEIQAEVPIEMGTGRFRSLTPREGMRIDFIETCFHEEFSNTLTIMYPALEFTFYLSGVKHMTGASASGKRTVLFDEKGGGISTAAHFRELECEYSLKRAARNVNVSIHISPSILRASLGDQLDGLPRELHDIAEGADRQEYGHTGSLSRAMSSALFEMLHCPYSGSIRKIFMEGKALELVAHKLAQIQSEKITSKPTRFGKRDDLERIFHAETLLRKDLEQPPMLSELAGAVGISYKKLNAGFRDVFGTTVFGRLRHIRLERARYLMEKQGKNVAEAAFTVGYNSLPSFSNAFSKFFGVSPGRCMRR